LVAKLSSELIESSSKPTSDHSIPIDMTQPTTLIATDPMPMPPP